jgi:hypothetical protein
MPQVEKVMPVQKRHKLVSRESHPANTVINVDGVPVAGCSSRSWLGRVRSKARSNS